MIAPRGLRIRLRKSPRGSRLHNTLPLHAGSARTRDGAASPSRLWGGRPRGSEWVVNNAQVGIKAVFDEAIRAVLNKPGEAPADGGGGGCCVVS